MRVLIYVEKERIKRKVKGQGYPWSEREWAEAQRLYLYWAEIEMRTDEFLIVDRKASRGRDRGCTQPAGRGYVPI